ncbi:hypothetical protein F5887DRAFT_1072164 [Amanita rubescens]|nr:hypothetical protein F5887DRAFT_1072164 [Amanita rubescens]
MSGNHPNFRILFGDPLTHKKVPIRRWTIGAARDKAITEIRSHLGDLFPDATTRMPLAKDVKIFRESSQPNAPIRKLCPSENSDYLAFVPPPANIGFGALLTKLNNDIEQLKKDSEVARREHEQKLSEHERALVDLRAQQATLSWIVLGDEDR